MSDDREKIKPNQDLFRALEKVIDINNSVVRQNEQIIAALCAPIIIEKAKEERKD